MNQDYEDRWLHGDIVKMAFFYTHKLFESLTENGELK